MASARESDQFITKMPICFVIRSDSKYPFISFHFILLLPQSTEHPNFRCTRGTLVFDVLEQIKNARNTAKTARRKASDRQEGEGTETDRCFRCNARCAVGTGEECRLFRQAGLKNWRWLGIYYNYIV